MTPIQPHHRPQRHADTASRTFDDEAVVISPGQNKVRMLNHAGTRIWKMADGSRSVAEIAAGLTAEFEVEYERALASVTAFVQEMVDEQLMVLNPERTSRAGD